MPIHQSVCIALRMNTLYYGDNLDILRWYLVPIYIEQVFIDTQLQITYNDLEITPHCCPPQRWAINSPGFLKRQPWENYFKGLVI